MMLAQHIWYKIWGFFLDFTHNLFYYYYLKFTMLTIVSQVEVALLTCVAVQPCYTILALTLACNRVTPIRYRTLIVAVALFTSTDNITITLLMKRSTEVS